MQTELRYAENAEMRRPRQPLASPALHPQDEPGHINLWILQFKEAGLVRRQTRPGERKPRLYRFGPPLWWTLSEQALSALIRPRDGPATLLIGPEAESVALGICKHKLYLCGWPSGLFPDNSPKLLYQRDSFRLLTWEGAML